MLCSGISFAVCFDRYSWDDAHDDNEASTSANKTSIGNSLFIFSPYVYALCRITFIYNTDNQLLYF